MKRTSSLTSSVLFRDLALAILLFSLVYPPLASYFSRRTPQKHYIPRLLPPEPLFVITVSAHPYTRVPFTLSLARSDTILSVKTMIQARTRIPREHQLLLSGRTHLQDDRRTLARYGLYNASTLHLVLCVPGEMRFRISNYLAPGLDLSIHCQNGAEDLGARLLPYRHHHDWVFSHSFLQSRRYACRMEWRDALGGFHLFTDPLRCHCTCLWSVRSDGVYLRESGTYQLHYRWTDRL